MPERSNMMHDKKIIYRHSWPVRLTHWINALVLLVLLMSGLQIFNAHPALYFGQASDFVRPILAMDVLQSADGPKGVRNLKRDFPVVIVTHNVAQARRVSDHVLFIYEGALIEAGPAERVFAVPRSRLARDFISGQFG
jgi:ABC-type enterochelin transport system ATPase subunit